MPFPNRAGRPPAPIEHGTEGGYWKHRRRHIPLCDACADAHRRYERDRKHAEYWNAKQRMTTRISNHDRIADLLGVDGGWWTAANVADRLNLKLDTAERALHRMFAEGRVRKRMVSQEWGMPDRAEWASA